jgi:DNA-binding Lrp family transcriptional regulator
MSPEVQLETDLDEVDLAILRQIERNSDVNLTNLAEDLDLSKSAIHYRLNKLKDNDIVETTSADVDPLKLGLNMLMVTNVFVSHESGYAEDIGQALTEVDGVYQVYYTMGDVDFVVISRTQDRDQMNDLIDDIVAIDGVNETSSHFVMKELKRDGQVVNNMSDEMVDNVLDD